MSLCKHGMLLTIKCHDCYREGVYDLRKERGLPDPGERYAPLERMSLGETLAKYPPLDPDAVGPLVVGHSEATGCAPPGATVKLTAGQKAVLSGEAEFKFLAAPKTTGKTRRTLRGLMVAVENAVWQCMDKGESKVFVYARTGMGMPHIRITVERNVDTDAHVILEADGE